MEGAFWIIDSEPKLSNLITHIQKEWELHHWLSVKITNGKIRSTRQNAALHAWFRDVANELNAKGIDYKHFFTRFDFEFTEHSVKDHLWKPVQKAVLGTDETHKLERDQVSKIYDVLNRKLSEHGIHIPLGKEFKE